MRARAGNPNNRVTTRARRRALAAVVAALVALGLVSGGVAQGAPAQTDPVTELLIDLGVVTTTTTTTAPRPTPHVPRSTRLATPAGDVATYDRPGGTQIGWAGHWYGYRQTMPILRSQDGWLLVRLPERPNGKTAWIESRHVHISSTPYRIVIRRSRPDLTLYHAGFPVFTVPVGLGTAKTPTPLGNYYLGVIEQDSRPGWGPVILNTTAHSEAIQSWQGSGDAITAIHGPISASSDRQIGTTGAYLSNGCVRMHQADLQRLAVVPLGSPVDIVD